MVTSIQIDDRTKGQLEDLQTEIKTVTGHTVTEQELLERLVDTVYESRSEFVDSLRNEWDGLSDEEIDGMLSETGASDEAVDEDDLDEMLY